MDGSYSDRLLSVISSIFSKGQMMSSSGLPGAIQLAIARERPSSLRQILQHSTEYSDE